MATEADVQEEYFVVRYQGTQEKRDLVYDWLTGQSNDYRGYAELVTRMDVNRGTQLKDLLFFPRKAHVSPKIGKVARPKEPPQRSPPKPKPLHKVRKYTRKADDSHEFGGLKEVKSEKLDEEAELTRAIEAANREAAHGGFSDVFEPSGSSEAPETLRTAVGATGKRKSGTAGGSPVKRRPGYVHRDANAEMAPVIYTGNEPANRPRTWSEERARRFNQNVISSELLKKHNITFSKNTSDTPK